MIQRVLLVYKSGFINEGGYLMEAQGQRAIDRVLKWVVTGAHADVNSAVPLTIKRWSSIHNLKRKNHDLNIICNSIIKTSRLDVHWNLIFVLNCEKSKNEVQYLKSKMIWSWNYWTLTTKSMNLWYFLLSSGMQTWVPYGIPIWLSIATLTWATRPSK